MADTDIARFTELLAKHLQAGKSNISYDDYVREKGESLYSSIGNRKIVYLDTNAWKCLSDFKRGKTNLTEDMIDYSTEMFKEDTCKKFLFPLTMSTIFELQSMDDPETIDTLSNILDKFSESVCIIPDVDRIKSEIQIFLGGKELLPRKLYFVRPFELMNVPLPEFPAPIEALKLIYKKATYDLLAEKPVSVYLTDEMFTGDASDQWDNNAGIDAMNAGKAANQEDIKSLQHGLFIELAGVFDVQYLGQSKMPGMTPSKWLAIESMLHWKDNPLSSQLVTARVMANIHSILRYEKNRNFKKGDVADFSTATTAIPVCDALFTDNRLMNIVNDVKVEISKFCNCKIIGFSEFGKYLRENR